ncbi:hypothetical protein [Chromobacterium sp. ATCC 53434]|uniref:hypothetical protein n=1 Tax=Chromobacterium sp. (strain ATCC 53434 / SC 14030) TaxID=2059672 RepID=UPI0013050DC8|nr:hypothetical protein [Chromobacterium sp. ATCC 53434]
MEAAKCTNHEKRLLIISHPLDLHAAMVSFSLKSAGYFVDLWHPSEFPAFQQISYCIENNTESFYVENTDIFKANYTSIWNRKAPIPAIPKTLHPLDIQSATRQSRWFLEYIQHLLRQCRWINPLESWRKAEYKPLQLKIAKKCGFKIPPTLISNDSFQIKEFFQKAHGEIIAKPLLPECIELDSGAVGAVFVEKLNESDLGNEQTLHAMPYIYQYKIDIDYEIRIVALGKDLIAAKIMRDERKKMSDSHLDTHNIKPFTLSSQVTSCCLKLMKEMNLEFSCIDLAVNKKGEVFFLEINQAGQFLFLDQALKNNNILKKFCSFFTQDLNLQEKSIKSLTDTVSNPEFIKYFKHIIQNTKNHEGLIPKTSEKSLKLL